MRTDGATSHVRLIEFALIHRDPFDRLLISTALEEKFVIITDDREIGKYDVEIMW